MEDFVETELNLGAQLVSKFLNGRISKYCACIILQRDWALLS